MEKKKKKKPKLTACARLNVSSEALTPAFLSTLTRLIGWKRWSVSTKTPRWFVLRLSICLRKSRGQRSLQMNLMLSRGDWGRGRLALNLWIVAEKSLLVTILYHDSTAVGVGGRRLVSVPIRPSIGTLPHAWEFPTFVFSSASCSPSFPLGNPNKRNAVPTAQQAPARPGTPSHPTSKRPHPASHRPALPPLPEQSYPSSRRRPQS